MIATLLQLAQLLDAGMKIYAEFEAGKITQVERDARWATVRTGIVYADGHWEASKERTE